MKNIAIKIFITLVIFLNVTIVVGQTSGAVLKQDSKSIVSLNKNENSDKVLLSVGAVFAHFSLSNDNKSLLSLGESAPLNPGVEILINYRLLNCWSISSGLNYQFGRFKVESTPSERLTFGELTAPILTTFYLFSNKINVTTGIYFGKYIHLRYESRNGKIGPRPELWGDITKHMAGYSEDRFISDFYFSVGCNTIKKPKGFFQFNLFAKYRLNEMWFNKHVSKFVFGAKINYLINTKL